MSVPALTQFRMFLDRLNPSDRGDQLRFFRLLALAGEEGGWDLQNRLLKSSTPKEVRLLFVEAAFYYSWKGWTEILGTLLRRESDLAVFSVGVWALGRMGGDALAILQGLYATCTEPTFKEILSLEILRTDPRQAFDYHLQRLMEGSGNPRVANEAASELVKLEKEERLTDLAVLARHEDLLIARHALKLLSLLRTPEAGAFFLAFLQETHGEILADRELKDLLTSLRTVTGPALLDVLTPHLDKAFGPKTLEWLQGGQRPEAVAQLRSGAQNPLEVFLVDALTLVMEARWTAWSTLLSSAGEALHQRSRQAAFTVDTCAQALGALVEQGVVDRHTVLEVIKPAYQAQTGREGMAHVFGTLVDSGDEEGLDILLAGQDGTLRAAALEALGARAEPALMPTLLRACGDPIMETAQRAVLSLGRIPGIAQVVAGLLQNGNVDEVRLALNLAGVNRLTEVVPEVLRQLATSSREDLILACAETLGFIGAQEAVPALLELLHSGQSQRMQIALATALRDLGGVLAAMGLAERANLLRNPQVHLLAAEAMIGAHGTPENALPVQGTDLLRQQIQGCWEEKNPWATRHRLILALRALWSEDPALYPEVVTLISTTLAEKRCQTVWSALEQAAAKSVARELAERAEAAAAAS